MHFNVIRFVFFQNLSNNKTDTVLWNTLILPELHFPEKNGSDSIFLSAFVSKYFLEAFFWKVQRNKLTLHLTNGTTTSLLLKSSPSNRWIKEKNGNRLSFVTGGYQITNSQQLKKYKGSTKIKWNTNNKVRYNPELN